MDWWRRGWTVRCVHDERVNGLNRKLVEEISGGIG